MRAAQSISAPVVRLVATPDGGTARTIPVLGNYFLIGRDKACQLRPSHPMVSRRHAEIRMDGEDVYIVDLMSRNGTQLNGKDVTGPTLIHDGDTIRIVSLEFTVSMGTPEEDVAAGPPSDDVLASWLTHDEDDRSPSATR